MTGLIDESIKQVQEIVEHSKRNIGTLVESSKDKVQYCIEMTYTCSKLVRIVRGMKSVPKIVHVDVNIDEEEFGDQAS